MKKLLFAILLISLTLKLSAQQKPVPLVQPPLPFREVSGIVKDDKGETVIGALVTLKSTVDTIRTATNEDGIFVIKNVKKAVFNVTVTYLGSEPFIKKYLNNDQSKKIILEPITLKPATNQLNEVTINGTPSVTYKTDTVEYRAADYKVRANATLDELIKKMEGMEVGTDGSLVHQGENVVQAKLNGKTFNSGSVAQALKTLPADIVEKIQIVDDYGDQAARTGIKTGLPQKVLNITTKPDRSVGTQGRLVAQAGNNDRYNFGLSGTRINANQVFSVNGNIKNTVDGIGGGNPGTTMSGRPEIGYTDQWSKKVEVNSHLAYDFSNNNSINHQWGNDPTTLGVRYFDEQGSANNSSRGYNGHFQIKMDLDSAKNNFLQITPSFSKSHSNNARTFGRDQTDDFRDTLGNSLFQHQISNGSSSTYNENNNYNLNVFFLHKFMKPKRNISSSFNFSNSTSKANGGSNRLYKFYADSTRNNFIRDSTINVLTERNNHNRSYSGRVTYTEPLGELSLLDFTADLNKSDNNAEALQYEIDPLTKQLALRNDLSNVYGFTTTQGRYTGNYRYDGKKVTLSLGVTAIEYNLSGTKLNVTSGQNEASSRSTFRVVPAFRFAYQWTRTQRFQLNYNGGNVDPQFQQIQPFTDRSNPNNIVVGNPDLNPGFNHSINSNYNNYIANSRFNVSLSAYANFYDNKITTNNINIRVTTPAVPAVPPSGTDPGSPAKPAVTRNINQTNFINLGGSHSYGGGYSFSKQLDDRRYNISLNGGINYAYNTAMSNNILYHTTRWNFDTRFGPRINPNDNIEVNPYIGYNLTRSFATSRSAIASQYTTTSLAINGKMYFLKTYQINYNASKNFVSGIVGATNPFIVNMGFQKEFLEKRNLVVTFDVYDLLYQNSFIRRDVAEDGGITNTLSNTSSRYFMVGVRLNLQKWSGRPQRNGKNMQRRGDGSFIYN